MSAFALPYGLSDDREQPVPTRRPQPAPDLPDILALKHREEDDLRATNDVLKRHIADLTQDAAIRGIVAVVAHHEVMVGRYQVDRRVGIEAVIDQIERRVAHAVRQRLPPTFDPHGRT